MVNQRGLKRSPLRKKQSVTKINPLEHEVQASFFSYTRAKAKTNPDYESIFAVPNYRRCNIQTAKYLDAEGRETGVLDVFVAVPTKDYHGLFIEFKRRGCKPTPEQLKWARRFTKKGYLVKVIDNIDDAIRLIDWYLNQKTT